MKYLVTIVLVTGYYWNEKTEDYDLDSPKLKPVEFEIEANDEFEAMEIAKKKENSSYSIWESYITEI